MFVVVIQPHVFVCAHQHLSSHPSLIQPHSMPTLSIKFPHTPIFPPVSRHQLPTTQIGAGNGHHRHHLPQPTTQPIIYPNTNHTSMSIILIRSFTMSLHRGPCLQTQLLLLSIQLCWQQQQQLVESAKPPAQLASK